MMKRPKGILWIGIWLGIFGYVHLGSLRRAVSSYPIQSGIPAIVMLGGLALLIWEIYGLRKLYAVQRWISVGIFSWWGISAIFKIPFIQSPPIPTVTNARILQGILLIISILNAVSIWYLVRPSFRTVCTQFVEENKLQKKLLK